MGLIKELKAEMPAGVQVVSDHDGNHDGYDDDGRLTFLAGGKAVTLTIGNTPKQVGTVTYGATWQTRAPGGCTRCAPPPAASPPRRASPAADPPLLPRPDAPQRPNPDTRCPNSGRECSGRGGEGGRRGRSAHRAGRSGRSTRGSTCTTIRRRQCVQYRGGSSSRARAHAACSPAARVLRRSARTTPYRRRPPASGTHRHHHHRAQSVWLSALIGIFEVLEQREVLARGRGRGWSGSCRR